LGGVWVCFSGARVVSSMGRAMVDFADRIGFGWSPLDAYDDWLLRELRA
jgi:hypothetical protein